MGYKHIVHERNGQTAWIYLNRPENMNSLSKALMEEILHVLEEIEQDESVRVLVLCGKGKAFCAGADLKELLGDLEKDPDGQDGLLDLAGKLFERLNRFSKPLIAALNGITLAGGLELAMTADIIIASEIAKIGDAHSNFGVLPGAGGAVRLPRKVGINRAKYLLFTGDFISAKEMKDFGLVNEVVAPENLEGFVQEIADKISTKSPLVLKEMKRLVEDGLEQPLEIALRQELLALKNHTQSHDFREGISAFTEKRTPNFKGY
ncbi:enoyl-CoA hydratase/isomerase family protein [Neobacillus vireti]|uniref:3-hydroxypropionyl-coenzyme A dehydratase n=1 Tax=Neobacillus vireti LMG 21834 TaxID=1131730 RepID=A0AB94INW2_9BACI|nr:enoyl-CoA hydratase/isomerase family protein [Neobacillus vireti]ETI68825.1 3-hydroxypropionyl-coenzyme A dehydratase [Neobacillus vireti LMG 21834]KLT19608.1 enoyl-CoA hydratase [Neobacillus vireti]